MKFQITEGSFKTLRKKAVLETIPILLIAATVGITVSTINNIKVGKDVNVLPIVIPLVLASLGVGLFLGVNRQKKSFESYTLTISNNLVTREQPNIPMVSLYFNEIQKIVKHKNGGFVIKGKNPR